MTYNWVQGDYETVETDISNLDGAPDDLDLNDRTVNFILRHWNGAKVAHKEATIDGTTATVELTPDNLSLTKDHEAEWRITGGSDDPTTLPKDSPIEDITVRSSVNAPDDVISTLAEDAEVDILTANGLTGSLVGGSTLTSLLSGNLKNESGRLVAPDNNTQLSQSDVRDAINTDSDHGSTAQHNYIPNTDTQLDPTSLEDGGTNELSVEGLSGDRADPERR